LDVPKGKKKRTNKLLANFGYYSCHFVIFFEKDIYHKFPVFLKKNWQKVRKKLEIHQKLSNHLQHERVLKVFLFS
jgi:hypothetical protein